MNPDETHLQEENPAYTGSEMRKETQKSAIRLQGESRTVESPVFDLEDYVIRIWNPSDFGQIASFTDPSLYNQLDEESLEKMTETGYSFESGKRGLVGFVAEEKRTGDIAGRSYLETWHGDDFTNPRYRETAKGIQVIAAREQTHGAEKIVELGGWLVSPDHRGKKLSQALAYASIDFIKRMQDQDCAADFAFVTNVGPLKPQDNSKGIDYAARMKDTISANGYDPSDLKSLAEHRDDQGSHPVVITPGQLRKIFSDLSTPYHEDGKMIEREYRFGDPRNESMPAYQISKKIAEGKSLITLLDQNGGAESMASSVKFSRSREMNTVHGGIYTISLPVPNQK